MRWRVDYRCQELPGGPSGRLPQSTGMPSARLVATSSITARRPAAAGSWGPRPVPDRAGRHEVPYLAIMSLDPTGKSRQRWTNSWKAPLIAFDITFDGRLSAGRN